LPWTRGVAAGYQYFAPDIIRQDYGAIGWGHGEYIFAKSEVLPRWGKEVVVGLGFLKTFGSAGAGLK